MLILLPPVHFIDKLLIFAWLFILVVLFCKTSKYFVPIHTFLCFSNPILFVLHCVITAMDSFLFCSCHPAHPVEPLSVNRRQLAFESWRHSSRQSLVYSLANIQRPPAGSWTTVHITTWNWLLFRIRYSHSCKGVRVQHDHAKDDGFESRSTRNFY